MEHNRPGRSGWSSRVDHMSVLGYATVSESADARSAELKLQAERIAQHCDEHGLTLREVVSERDDAKQKGPRRPGLEYAMGQLTAGEAQGLVVTELSRFGHSAVDLGTIINWVMTTGARLIAIAEGLDTGQPGGQFAADLLVQVANWERDRLSERTRKGLAAARRKGRSTGRPSVRDFPALSRRILSMRAQGMTLQAIADQLNEEDIPTVRGGAKWRHSSVQAVSGYQRRKPNGPCAVPGDGLTAPENS